MKRLLILCLLALCTLVSNAQEAKVKMLNAKDFHQKIKDSEDILILDCSTIDTYTKEHIEGAITIATSDMMKSLLSDINKDTVIMLYCKYGDRSMKAYSMILELGFNKVYELDKGLVEWKRQAYKTTNK
jgi:rhodanese-related sulfurtransferase